MKLSERLLEMFDAKAAADREKLQAQALDVDALGLILATAHYDGIDCSPEGIHAHGDSILVYSSAPESALAWMLRTGFSLVRVTSQMFYTHNYMRHPDITCPVVILTSKEGAELP